MNWIVWLVLGVLGLSHQVRAQGLAGQAVFAKIRPMVFKVKTSPSAESPQASYGTGFVVDTSGLLMTNYHVVASSIVEPEKNHIYVMLENESLPAQILALDIVNDLALIRVKHRFSTAVKFSLRKLQQGQSIFSIGQPEDLNMAIVAGTYNNELEYGPYQIIHLSAPINAGMSGGPTVNAAGEVVGVNVSKNVNSSNLSFSVPARYAQSLFAIHRMQKEAPKTFWESMQTQLLDLQNVLTKEILHASQDTKEFHAWRIPQVPSYLKCWSSASRGDPDSPVEFEVAEESCSLPHSSYIDESTSIGSFSVGTDAVENRKLNSWQFFEQLGRQSTIWPAFAGGFGWMHTSREKLVTDGKCIYDVVVNTTGATFKISYCARAYVHFPKLQDTRVVLTSLDSSKSGLVVDLTFLGFTKENISQIFHLYFDKLTRGQL